MKKKTKPRLYVIQLFVFGKWHDIDFVREKEFVDTAMERYKKEHQKARVQEFVEAK